MKRTILGLLILVVLVQLQLSTKADGDNVFFTYGNDYQNRTYEILVGEEEINFIIIFEEDCDSWSYYLSDYTIFLTNFSEDFPFEQNKDDKYVERVPLDRNAPPGDYYIDIFFNYTASNGSSKNNVIPYHIKYIRPFEILNISIPGGYQRSMVLEVQTYVNFSRLTIIFDSDGDIAVMDEETTYKDLPLGKYTFSTRIKKRMTFAGDQQEVAYHIIGEYKGHVVETYEYNIDVSVMWDEDEENNEDPFILVSLIGILIIIAILANYAILRWRRRK
jgi:hypothetical protein